MLKKLFIVLLLAAAGLFFASAYVSTKKFRDALETRDAKTVQEMVDWPAVEASMKEQMRELVKTFLRKQIGAKADSPEVEREIDAQFAAAFPKFDAQYLIQGARERPGKPDAKELVIDSRFWSPVRDFKMWFEGDKTAMRFRFNGDGWKLVALEFDPDEVQQVFQGQMTEHMQEAMDTRAARAAQARVPGPPRPASMPRR